MTDVFILLRLGLPGAKDSRSCHTPTGKGALTSKPSVGDTGESGKLLGEKSAGRLGDGA